LVLVRSCQKETCKCCYKKGIVTSFIHMEVVKRQFVCICENILYQIKSVQLSSFFMIITFAQECLGGVLLQLLMNFFADP
jgi:hypothetical protein